LSGPRQEILEVLGEGDGSLFCDFFDVTETGNFEGDNILHVTSSIAEAAARTKFQRKTCRRFLILDGKSFSPCVKQRVKPGRDEKVLTAWNGFNACQLC